jgi:hypothetical protein
MVFSPEAMLISLVMRLDESAGIFYRAGSADAQWKGTNTSTQEISSVSCEIATM